MRRSSTGSWSALVDQVTEPGELSSGFLFQIRERYALLTERPVNHSRPIRTSPRRDRRGSHPARPNTSAERSAG